MSDTKSSTLKPKILEALQQKLKPEQISTQPTDLQHYGKDWLPLFKPNPTAVFFPFSTEDVQKIILWAREYRIPLVPSGGRTGLSGGAAAENGEVVVSLEKMNHILDFNETNHSVTCQAGVVTQTLQDYVKEKGFLFPIDFAARGSSQIGGNIATNAGGIKVIRYGLTRNWINTLTVVTGQGEILHLGKNLTKDATGYDLKQLFIGSEGTLGIVTEATLNVTTPPTSSQVMLLGCSNLESILPLFREFQKHCTLQAFEFFTQKALPFVLPSLKYSFPMDTEVAPLYLLVEIESDQLEEVEKALQIFETGVQNGLILDGVLSQSEKQFREIWSFRENISEKITPFFPYKNDVSVPIDNIPQTLQELEMLLQAQYPTFQVIWFGHIGDGNIHINILKPQEMDREEFLDKCKSVDHLLFKVIQKYSGSISAEHGLGVTKKNYLSYSKSAEEIRLMRSIKTLFDPDGIMNPGKVI